MQFFATPPLRDFPDHALRVLLTDPHHLAGVLRRARPGLAARLDFAGVREEKPRFTLQDFREREADLLFLVPFLNAASEQADVGTAASVINAVLLSHRDHADLGVPVVPLRDLHGIPAARLLTELGAEIRTGAEVTAIRSDPDGGYRVHLGRGAAQQQPDQLPLGLDDPDIIAAAGVVSE